jgi:hypothetical protein
VEVTPELAAEWLTNNPNNRNIRPKQVGMLAKDMLDGDWLRNGETIKFGPAGQLLDGQHRLAAVVKAGEENPDISVQFLVVRDVAPEAQMTMDTGTRRGIADQLRILGYPNPTAVASVLRGIVAWESGRRRDNERLSISHPLMMEALHKYPEVVDIAREAVGLNQKVPAPPSLIGLAMWLFYRLNEEDAKVFFEKLESGADMGPGEAIFELRKTLLNNKASRREWNRAYMMAVVIKAWNAYRNGTIVGQLSWRGGGSSPEQFPEPN